MFDLLGIVAVIPRDRSRFDASIKHILLNSLDTRVAECDQLDV